MNGRLRVPETAKGPGVQSEGGGRLRWERWGGPVDQLEHSLALPSDRLRDVHLTPAMLVSLSAESSVRNTRTELGNRRRSRHENETRKGRWKDRC